MAKMKDLLDKSLVVRMPEGLHALIREHAEACGKSTNLMLIEILAFGVREFEDPENEGISLQYRGVQKTVPDYWERLESAEFIIRHGITREEWRHRMIDAGFAPKDTDG